MEMASSVCTSRRTGMAFPFRHRRATSDPTADPATNASAANARQSLLLAALGGEDVLSQLRAAWALDGWLPPRKEVASYFYWTLPKRKLGEHNPQWRAMAFSAQPPATPECIPRIDFPIGSKSLPPAVQKLLKARECCVMRKHGLWPAAASWGDPGYLRAELSRVPMRVLGNTMQRRDFHYFREGTEGVNANGLFSAEKLKLPKDEWMPPPVSVVYMNVSDFLTHRGVEETDAVELHYPEESTKHAMCAKPGALGVERTCLYLQHHLLEPSSECVTAEDCHGPPIKRVLALACCETSKSSTLNG
mmetsp:Transcript_50957/g.84459  ORF Transcript_50957/g.84459 Transcript_50957/m.84459 type:complete len:304 (+) Transcript_50957:201-1112(+)